MSCSSLERLSVIWRWTGPDGPADDERHVDLGRLGRRQLDLGLLGGLADALEGDPVRLQVDALLLLELGDDPVHDGEVEVVAAEERVAVGREDLDDALADAEDRDVERATAEVVDGDDLFLAGLVQPVGECRGGRLVDDAQDLEAGDLAGVLGRLALGVVEVGRDRDDRLRDLVAELRLGVRAQLLEDHGGDLGWRVLLATHGHPDIAVLGARRPCTGRA